jgi:hypothetical protein
MCFCLLFPRETGVASRAARVRWTAGVPTLLLPDCTARAPAGMYVFHLGGVQMVEVGHHVVKLRPLARCLPG